MKTKCGDFMNDNLGDLQNHAVFRLTVCQPFHLQSSRMGVNEVETLMICVVNHELSASINSLGLVLLLDF